MNLHKTILTCVDSGHKRQPFIISFTQQHVLKFYCISGPNFFYCDPELHDLTILPSRIRKQQQQHQKPQNKPLRKHIQHLEKLVQHNLAYVYTVNRDGSATLYNIYFKMYKNDYIERFFSSFRVTQFQNKFQLLARGSAGRIDGHISIE